MATIYADNAATTQMSRAAIDAMLPYLETIYGNPSSLHSVGQQAAGALLSARDRIAKCLNASPREIYFTSGGSEADNQTIVMTLFLPSVASLPVPICTGYSSQRKVVRLPNGEKNKLQMQHQMIKNRINHFSINIRKTHNKREKIVKMGVYFLRSRHLKHRK